MFNRGSDATITANHNTIVKCSALVAETSAPAEPLSGQQTHLEEKERERPAEHPFVERLDRLVARRAGQRPDHEPPHEQQHGAAGEHLTHHATHGPVAAADRHSSSTLAEGLILAVALIWSSVTVPYAAALAGSTWEGTVIAGVAQLSWAGETARFVSNPLFLFLALRWFWWLVVWTALLYRISRLPLQLTPLHPDRAAGLGFLGPAQVSFGALAFGMGSILIASALYMSVRGPGLSLHEFMISLFIGITTPVGSHLLAKAARHRRLPGSEGWTDGDQARNR